MRAGVTPLASSTALADREPGGPKRPTLNKLSPRPTPGYSPFLGGRKQACALQRRVLGVCCTSTGVRSILLSKRKGKMTDQRIDLPQGTLDLLILKTLAHERQHGWGVSERIQQISNSVLQVQQGSLYPALHRLQRRGWIRARWGVSENNRRAKYYELTASGRKQLDTESEAWRTLANAIGQVLDTA